MPVYGKDKTLTLLIVTHNVIDISSNQVLPMTSFLKEAPTSRVNMWAGSSPRGNSA